MMNLYVVITVLIVIVVARMVLAQHIFKPFMNKRGKQVNVFLGAVFAVSLVLLGISLSSHQSREAQLEVVLSLLGKGHHDIYQTRQEVIAYYEMMARASQAEQSTATKTRPIELPSPKIFLNMLDNESIVKSMNDEMLESARAFQDNSANVLKWYAVDTIPDSIAAGRAHLYGAELFKIEEILALFIEALEQDISDSVFSVRKQVIVKKHLALVFDKEIAAGRRQHPWRTLGP